MRVIQARSSEVNSPDTELAQLHRFGSPPNWYGHLEFVGDRRHFEPRTARGTNLPRSHFAIRWIVIKAGDRQPQTRAKWLNLFAPAQLGGERFNLSRSRSCVHLQM